LCAKVHRDRDGHGEGSKVKRFMATQGSLRTQVVNRVSRLGHLELERIAIRLDDSRIETTQMPDQFKGSGKLRR